jgi:hypothetical protein
MVLRARVVATLLAVLFVVVPVALSETAAAAGGASSVPPSFTRTTWSQGKVTLYWTDNSDNETSFSLQAGTTGQWHQVGEVLTRDTPGVGGQYTWTDPTPLTVADGDRCYRVVLAYPTGGQTPGISETRCLSAPAPPAAPPTTTQPTKASAPPRTTATTAGNPTTAVTSGGPAPANVGPDPVGSVTGRPGDRGPAPNPAVGGPRPASRSGALANAWALVGVSAVVFGSGLVAGGWIWARRRRTAVTGDERLER